MLEINERLYVKVKTKTMYVLFKFQHFALPGVVTQSGFLRADVEEYSFARFRTELHL